MDSQENDVEFALLGESSVDSLSHHQQKIFADTWNELVALIRTKGKQPDENKGLAESNIRPTARRIYQVFAYAWEDRFVLQITPKIADDFIEGLKNDSITRNDGYTYTSTSKRKFSNALETYFAIEDIEWTPSKKFVDGLPELESDPFDRDERELLFNTSLEYRKPPTYSNLSKDERERWKRHISQLEGIPMDEVTQEDWERLKRSWKVPAIISTSLDAGWRAIFFDRWLVDWVDLEKKQIHIPGHAAVKNDQNWDQVLSQRSITILEHWLKERDAIEKYDDSDYLFLNRNGNTYKSHTLNDLLTNLIEEAGIPTNGRKLTWHSIRHSTGMYVYEEKEDLAIVAEILRQTSLESAKRYTNSTPESKSEVVESLQGL